MFYFVTLKSESPKIYTKFLRAHFTNCSKENYVHVHKNFCFVSEQIFLFLIRGSSKIYVYRKNVYKKILYRKIATGLNFNSRDAKVNRALRRKHLGKQQMALILIIFINYSKENPIKRCQIKKKHLELYKKLKIEI